MKEPAQPAHTPGPWKVTPSEAEPKHEFLLWTCPVEIDHDKSLTLYPAIAQATNKAEAIANAELIAAAPQLAADNLALKAEVERLKASTAKSFGEACGIVAKNHGLGLTLVTGHKVQYFIEAHQLAQAEQLKSCRERISELEVDRKQLKQGVDNLCALEIEAKIKVKSLTAERDALQSENAKLREALEEFVMYVEDDIVTDHERYLFNKAKAALSKPDA